MKRWIWIILIVIVAGSVSGYSIAHYRENNRQYNQDLVSGRLAIENKNYAAAQNYFSDALLKKRNDKAANDLLHQTQRIVKADSAFKGQEFNNAKREYKVVSRDYPMGSKTLTRLGKKQYSLVIKVQKKFKDFSEQLKVAKELNASQMFMQSNAQLDLLFNDGSFKDSYYSTLYDQATKLQDANNSGMINSNNSIGSSDTAGTSGNQEQGGYSQSTREAVQPPDNGKVVQPAPNNGNQSTSSSQRAQNSKIENSRADNSSGEISQKAK
ncbi:hypothetical protein [Pediococcus claussenii]|uniref:Lipoprotein n=1 Tax=Pediococcus claussenii (strain ATCC BAA-344 / DSM 14800 / JCM 18046 / KCTC 3811 / LMG 21948 / P06) TaxID=701521 RepID=G8PAY6_PEDCP|nr:hypothetical protein [Pediococcus claussenii]AEV95854.1 lipoprotein [Pediococcus claussenii ATCC BAA-344]ANZ69350.1 hypothetical protein AYR57_03095 [Pediococcus claussenii]ANZ71170.1 hypothetical protein AYR58_03110 [Pediococcus claussenii]